MSIELLDEPQIQVHDGVAHHIYAVDQPPATSEPGAERPQARPVGFVALTPITIGRCMESSNIPYMYHEATNVRGVIDGGEPVYDKDISPRGLLGVPLPFYGARLALAKMRAGRRVKSLLAL